MVKKEPPCNRKCETGCAFANHQVLKQIEEAPLAWKQLKKKMAQQ
jgi:hypothetical protein